MAKPSVTSEFGIAATNPDTGSTFLLPRHFESEDEAKEIAKVMRAIEPDSDATAVAVKVTIEQDA